MKTALTIAGSDSSGGAGIQADIKTMTANGVYAMSAITALTAQNTTGVTGIFEATPEFLAQEIDAIFTDIYPDAVKIGMVSSAELIGVIAEKLHTYGAKHIVVDPVMVATSGSKLLRDDAVQALTEKLLPMAEVVTPNIPELRSFRHEDHRCGRNGGRCKADQREIPLCRAVQGRPPDQRCRRPSVAGRLRQMVPRQAHCKPQYPRHRLHPIQRHCVQSGKGL